jgi:anti-anti-sigma factor
MPLSVLFDGGIAVVSNFSRVMNDPRYTDATNEIQDLLDKGFQRFVLDMGAVRETGSSFLGLLMSITRRIQKYGGEVVLAHLSRAMEEFLETMQMDGYWDVFATVDEAVESFRPKPEPDQSEPPE